MREDQLAVWHGTPLCNVITKDAKSMGFIWQTWCDVESAQSTFYRQFLSAFFDSTYLWLSRVAVSPKRDSDSIPKRNDLTCYISKLGACGWVIHPLEKGLIGLISLITHYPSLLKVKHLSWVSLIRTFPWPFFHEIDIRQGGQSDDFRFNLEGVTICLSGLLQKLWCLMSSYFCFQTLYNLVDQQICALWTYQ